MKLVFYSKNVFRPDQKITGVRDQKLVSFVSKNWKKYAHGRGSVKYKENLFYKCQRNSHSPFCTGITIKMFFFSFF